MLLGVERLKNEGVGVLRKDLGSLGIWRFATPNPQPYILELSGETTQEDPKATLQLLQMGLVADCSQRVQVPM